VKPAAAARRGEHWWPVAPPPARTRPPGAGIRLPGDAAHRVHASRLGATFADYLSLAFWTATAFSPTDTSAIKPWAKLLMIMEASVSLGLGALVIARAVTS